MRVPWLADVLRAEGLDVWESPGWQGRGKELASVEGVVAHHTGSSPKSSDTMVHAMLRDGRPDLAGPLSQLGLERDGTFVVIADGKANHNGYGTWGNNAIGIEAYNNGVGEPWPAVQMDAYDMGAAAILRRLKFGADRLKAHRETDPRRKPDPVGIDMDAMRARVAVLLDGRPQQSPQAPPTITGDPMSYRMRQHHTGDVWLYEQDGASLERVLVSAQSDPRPGHVDALKQMGVPIEGMSNAIHSQVLLDVTRGI